MTLRREAEAEGSEMCRVKVFREQILLGLSSMNLSLTNSSGGCWQTVVECFYVGWKCQCLNVFSVREMYVYFEQLFVAICC